MYRTTAVNSLIFKTIKSLADNNLMFTRNLFAANTLGLDTYIQSRDRTKLQIVNVDKFKSKMVEFVKDENAKNLIFTEDLKNMVHISQKEDVELLSQMIKRFCSQSKEVRFGNFIFGPPLMRFFHHVKDSESALKLFKDESLGGFFDQVITYQILLDLLFERGQYQEILDTFDIIQSRQLQGARYPKHVLILVFAGCYKMNTNESFEYAKKVWQKAVDAGHIPLRRGATFLSALALKQNQPFVALEILTNLKGQNYVSVRALKSLALARLKRFDDVIPIIRSLLDVTNPMNTKQTIPSDVIEEIQQLFKENNTNKDLQSEFEKIVGFLQTHGHLGTESLDQVLCSEIQINLDQQQQKQGSQQQIRRVRNFKPMELDRPSKSFRRPGLHELN